MRTQDQIAEAIGVTPQFISQWFKGKSGIKKATAEKLSRRFPEVGDAGFFMFEDIETIKTALLNSNSKEASIENNDGNGGGSHERAA